MFDLDNINPVKTRRVSSYDKSGKNTDNWTIQPKSTVKIADIKGPGKITHIWMTQLKRYREILISIKYDGNPFPSLLVPLGDFFCLGNTIVNSFQSFLFTASTKHNNEFDSPCALNCYAPMPFKERVEIELINDSDEQHIQYFYVDYELYDSVEQLLKNRYFHAEFKHKTFGGWAMDSRVDIV